MTTEIKEVIIGDLYNAIYLRRIGHNRYQWGTRYWDGIDWEDIPLFLVDALLKFKVQQRENKNDR